MGCGCGKKTSPSEKSILTTNRRTNEDGSITVTTVKNGVVTEVLTIPAPDVDIQE